MALTKNTKLLLVMGLYLCVFGMSTLSYKQLYVEKVLSYNVNIESDTTPQYYSKSFKVLLPRESSQNENSSFPTVIFVHGDNVDTNSFRILKEELLKRNIAVVEQVFDFTVNTFYEIKATIERISTLDYVDTNRIGLVGHSHGSHYALFYAYHFKNTLNFTIALNFGSRIRMLEDLGKLDWIVNGYDSYPDYIQSYRMLVKPQAPRNLLIMTDSFDPNYLSYHSHEDLLWSNLLDNHQIGALNEGTALEFYVKPSLFLHSAGLYDITFVNHEIQWIEQSFGMLAANSPLVVGISIFSNLLVFYSLIFLGIVIVVVLIGKVLNQNFFTSQEEQIMQVFKLKIDRHFSRQLKRIEKKKEMAITDPADLEVNKPKIISKLTGSSFDNMGLNQEEFEKELLKNILIKKMFKSIFAFMILLSILLSIAYLVLDPQMSIIYNPLASSDFSETINNLGIQLSYYIFLCPLEFNGMVIAAILLIFFETMSLDSFLEKKFKPNRLKYFGFMVLIFFEIFLSFLFFFTYVFESWTGFQLAPNLIAITLRFIIVFFITQSCYEHYLIKIQINNDRSHKDRASFMGLVAIIYLPVAFPRLDYNFSVLSNIIFFILPYLLIIFIYGVLIRRKNPITKITIIIFLLLTFRKLSVAVFSALV